MPQECHCTTFRAAMRRMAAAYDEALLPTGLNVAQFSLLRRIARGEPVSLTELAQRAELDRSTIGRNVRVLERDGFVEQRRGGDLREAAVALTRRGRKVLEDAAPLWQSCQQDLEHRVGRERMRVLREALERI
jgi:DNA-binding MarR family transcriptional regulator